MKIRQWTHVDMLPSILSASKGRRIFSALLISLFLTPSLSPDANAADKKDADNKRTVIRFDDDTISGDLMRPDGDLLWSRPRLDMPSLVHAPKAFDEEAQRSLSEAAQELWLQSLSGAKEGGGSQGGK